MARTKEFDPETALAKATELFRQRGYESASTSALVEKMGIGRSSLYETFGNKDELFATALNRYQQRAFGSMVAKLDAATVPLDAIREIFGNIGKAHVAGNRNGCLMVNTTVELAGHDEAMAEILRTAWGRLERAFVRALKKAQSQSELASDKNPKAIARYLLVVMRGMGVGTKLGTTRGVVNDVLSLSLQVLD